jgi:SnoaL-like domain
MHPNAQRLTDFYQAFARRDAGPMRALYAPDATFSDEAFPGLRGAEIGDMWSMLTERAKDFRLEFRDVQATDTAGSVHWEAWYLFQGKRAVHNVIEASFTFTPDGHIQTHVDHFDFWRWSRQALGLPGLLLGWSPMLRKTVTTNARQGLDAYRAKKGAV